MIPYSFQWGYDVLRTLPYLLTDIDRGFDSAERADRFTEALTEAPVSAADQTASCALPERGVSAHAGRHTSRRFAQQPIHRTRVLASLLTPRYQLLRRVVSQLTRAEQRKRIDPTQS